MKENRVKMLALILGLGLVVFSPSIAKAYTINWADNGYGNDGNWRPMDSFVFLSGTSGNFDNGNPPTIGQAGWSGAVIDNSQAMAMGPAIQLGDFGMSVTFTDPAPSSSYFDYFGYVGPNAAEGIRMNLGGGNWTGGWSYLDRGTAPPAGSHAVSEPATMMLLGSGLLGIAPFIRKRFKK